MNWGKIGELGSLLVGGGKGSSDERLNQNNFQTTANQQALQQFNIQQQSLLSALLAQGRDRQDTYGTRQGATTDAARMASQEGLSRYGTQQDATTTALGQQSNEGLARAQLGLSAPSVRAQQSILGSLMQNMQPVSIEAKGQVAGRVPTISGGLTPAALDPVTRQQGGALMQQALMAQLTGSDVPAATDFRSGILAPPPSTDFASSILAGPAEMDYTKGLLPPPSLAGYRGAGRGESIMSLLGMLMKGAGVLGGGNSSPRIPVTRGPGWEGSPYYGGTPGAFGTGENWWEQYKPTVPMNAP